MTDHEQVTWDAFAQTEEPEEPQRYDGRPLDTEDGCPWCLAPPETFTERPNGKVGCGLCMAVQPTDQPWYQSGEKIIGLRGASEIHQKRWEAVFA